MKKYVLLMTLIFVANTAFTQVYKNQWMVGGNATFNSTKHDDYKATTFQVNPNVGYFFIDRLAGGLRLYYANLDYGEGDTYSEITAAPFVRYYLLPATQKVNLLADASYGFGSIDIGKKEKINQYSFMAGPALFLTPNVGLEFTLGYTSKGGQYYDLTGKNERENTVGVNVGFQIHLRPAQKPATK